MVTILQTTFSKSFSCIEIYRIMIPIAPKFTQASNQQWTSNGSDKGLVCMTQQAMIWSNEGII